MLPGGSDQHSLWSKETGGEKVFGAGSPALAQVGVTILVGRLGTESAWHKVVPRLLKILSVVPWEDTPGEATLWWV